MSLDITKLEKVVELASGAKRARCPACAEAGQDRKGEHLRIYPDGRFGCCVFAGDGEHRKRIFALAGVRERQGISVKVAAPKPSSQIQSGLLGRLGRVFGGVEKPSTHITTPVGTLGTPTYSRACEQENIQKGEVDNRELIEFGTCVPSVPAISVQAESETPVPSVPSLGVELPPITAGERLPFMTAGGTLVIPFDSPERYHWWRGGQSVAATLREVRRQKSEGRMEATDADGV